MALAQDIETLSVSFPELDVHIRETMADFLSQDHVVHPRACREYPSYDIRIHSNDLYVRQYMAVRWCIYIHILCKSEIISKSEILGLVDDEKIIGNIDGGALIPYMQEIFLALKLTR